MQTNNERCYEHLRTCRRMGRHILGNAKNTTIYIVFRLSWQYFEFFLHVSTVQFLITER